MSKSSVTITLDSVDGLPVVRAAGELDLDALPAMRRAVASVAARQPRSVLIFDLRAVTFMDGSGLRMLVDAQKSLRRRQGEVVVITEQARVLMVLKLSGADRSFPIYPDEAAFLSSRERGKRRWADLPSEEDVLPFSLV